jgi:hypothetical protein
MRIVWLLALSIALPANAWTLRATGLGGWVGNTLTVNYNFTGCTMPDLTMLSVLDAGIAAWNTSQNSGIKLVRASGPVTATAADIVAGTATPTPLVACDTGFSANQTADGDFIPALTRLAASNSRIAFAGIVFNAETGKAAEISQLTPAELAVAFTHEMGHALGLGHSGDSLALMYYSISGKTLATLTQDDMDGIAYLYPRSEFTNGPYGCASTHRPASGRGAIWLLALLGLNLLLGRFVIRLRPKQLL